VRRLFAPSSFRPGVRHQRRGQIVDRRWINPDLAKLAVRFTDKKQYFVSEASVYRLLKAHTILSPARPTSSSKRPQGQDHGCPTSFGKPTSPTKVTGWGWYYLSTAPDDFSRFIVALRNDESPGRHRHAQSDAGGFRARSDDRRSPTAAAVE
jgi:transposase InsO family protein